MTEPLLPALTAALCDELDAALDRIAHCVGQLTDAQVWWRPAADMNAIGNLLLHLNGNVRQYIVCGVGGEPDDRDRPAEFAARDPVPKAELQRRVSETVDRAKAAITAAHAADLALPRTIQGAEQAGIRAVVRSVAHFRGHTQEIIHLTRTILGSAYQYAGPR